MKKVIAIIAALVILAGAGAGYWFTRPIYKAEKAMEVKDIVAVSDLYAKLKTEEKEQIAKEVLDYSEELVDSYIEQDMDYDEVKEELDKISSDMIDDEDGFDDIFDDMEKYKASRDAWDKANKLFEKEEYEAACDEYGKVIKDDYPYEDAQKKIDECKEKMVTQYAGDWCCSIDIGKGMLEKEGLGDYVDGGTSMTLKFIFVLKDDKTAELSVDADNFEQNFDSYIDVIIEGVIKKVAEENGLSVKEVNKILSSQLDMPFKDFIKKEMDFDSMVERLRTIKDEYTYDLKDGKLVFSNDKGDTTEATLEDGDMLIDDMAADTKKQYTDLGVELPLRFVKQK